MSVGVISGSGTESWPELERAERRVRESVYAQAELTCSGALAAVVNASLAALAQLPFQASGTFHGFTP